MPELENFLTCTALFEQESAAEGFAVLAAVARIGVFIWTTPVMNRSLLISEF
jgi:hypothetical protein